jgi:hypothetical protein
MKAIIDGKRYDTDTAERLGSWPKRAALAARWLEQEIEAPQQVNRAALSFAEFWASYPPLKDEEPPC